MKVYYSKLSKKTLLAQLQQLTQLTYDGDLISKKERDVLEDMGLVVKIKNGWNLITDKGIAVLEEKNLISK